MHTMTKQTLIVKDGEDGNRYVCRAIDEFTKNHRENDKELVSGFMTEIPNSELCPVKSYLSYVAKLHPSNEKFW